MIRDSLQALLACVVTFALCAVAYPAAVYGLGHALFPRQAEGSLIERDGKVIGSTLIAQPFASPRYFAPRPSAAGASGYAADAASGSNLAATNPALRGRITLDAARRLEDITPDCRADLAAALAAQAAADAAQADPTARAARAADLAEARDRLAARLAGYRDRADAAIPADLVTASGSGLDPDISPAAAYYQAARVAAARQLPVERVRALIDARVDRSGALLGAPPRVNVLLLNLDLDLDR